jgi:hypothetical protein
MKRSGAFEVVELSFVLDEAPVPRASPFDTYESDAPSGDKAQQL